jgi:hypothetical protein
MLRRQQLGHDVWALGLGYGGSEERWAAWALVTAIIGLDLGYVSITVRLHKANGTVFNAPQQYDTASFYHAFGTILVWVLILLTAVLLRVGGVITVEINRLYRLTTAYFTREKTLACAIISPLSTRPVVVVPLYWGASARWNADLRRIPTCVARMLQMAGDPCARVSWCTRTTRRCRRCCAVCGGIAQVP